MRRALTALLLLVFAVGPAVAEVRILSSSGGSVGEYLEMFSQLRQSGECIAIDGPCLSACTLVLSTIPRSRICVTGRAVLGFHAPRFVDDNGRSHPAPASTKAVVASYPAGVRIWLKQHGGLTSTMLLLRGRELTKLYPRC